MSKEREFHGMAIVTITCPHCGVDLHPMARPNDYARIECGGCGRWLELWRINGKSTVGKG